MAVDEQSTNLVRTASSQNLKKFEIKWELVIRIEIIAIRFFVYLYFIIIIIGEESFDLFLSICMRKSIVRDNRKCDI